MSKPEVVSNTKDLELAGEAEQRKGSRRILRSIWIGLFLGVLPTASPLFWLALPLPVIAGSRLVVVVLAAIVGRFAYPQLDSFVEPIGVAILQSPFAHAALTKLSDVRLLDSLRWYNSITAGYITIFVSGLAVLGFVKQAFRIGVSLGSVRITQRAKAISVSTAFPKPVADAAHERAVLSEVAVIGQVVQTAIAKVDENKKPAGQPHQPLERTLIVHEGHERSSKVDAQMHENAVERDYANEQKQPSAVVDLNDQVWEIPCFVENEIENVLLDEILQSMPCIVSSADQTTGIEQIKDVVVTDTLSPSQTNNKKRRRVTVKETIIDIVRWKKPSVQNAKAQPSHAVQSNTNETSVSSQTSDATRSSAAPQANVQQLSNSTIVMAAEPLPYLMGYLSNLNRNSEKAGGR